MTVTEPLPPLPESAPAPTRRRKRWPWVLVGVMLLVVVALVVADIAFRAYAEGQASAQIEQQLPENVDGDVTVDIGGASFLAQLLTGRFSEVTLDAPALTVEGVPLQAHAVATGVPTDLTQPIDTVTATVSIDEAAVNDIVNIPGDSGVVLGDGDVSYEGTLSLLGFELGYRVTAGVAADGDSVLIEPTEAALTQGAGNLDIDLDQLLGSLADDPIAVCVAQYLPEGAVVDSLDVVPGRATVQVSADDFVADEASLRTLGSC